MSERIPVGTEVTWTSQANGSAKTKNGRVVAYIPADADPFRIYPALKTAARTRVKFQCWSQVDRYLVLVPRGGQSVHLDYYAPLAKWLEQGREP